MHLRDLASIFLLLVLLTPPLECDPLKVASFNIRVFGLTKMKNPAVVEIITEIVSRYDIVLIQEIRDSTNKAIHNLLDELNNMGDDNWDIVLSKRLGRSSSKEQYGFLYKSDNVVVCDSYQWPDASDDFEREPFIVHFTSATENCDDGFGFLGVHIKPDDAPVEINKLTEVYDSVSSMWGLQDMLIAGDFNADCTYVRAKDWKTISLRKDPRFLWTIDDGEDTTMTDTNCAYDRLIIAGRNLQTEYVKGSAMPFKFDEAYGISRALALNVSDHYPVELTLS